jgi:hypothetical protein
VWGTTYDQVPPHVKNGCGVQLLAAAIWWCHAACYPDLLLQLPGQGFPTNKLSSQLYTHPDDDLVWKELS